MTAALTRAPTEPSDGEEKEPAGQLQPEEHSQDEHPFHVQLPILHGKERRRRVSQIQESL